MTEKEEGITPEEVGPADNLPQVLTAQEVADLLRISYKIVIGLAKSGEIPAFVVAGQWRFLKADIDAWLLAMSRRDYKGPDLPDRGNNAEV